MSKQRHHVGVSVEAGNLPVHPFEGQDHIVDAEIAGQVLVVEAEETWRRKKFGYIWFGRLANDVRAGCPSGAYLKSAKLALSTHCELFKQVSESQSTMTSLIPATSSFGKLPKKKKETGLLGLTALAQIESVAAFSGTRFLRTKSPSKIAY